MQGNDPGRFGSSRSLPVSRRSRSPRKGRFQGGLFLSETGHFVSIIACATRSCVRCRFTWRRVSPLSSGPGPLALPNGAQAVERGDGCGLPGRVGQRFARGGLRPQNVAGVFPSDFMFWDLPPSLAVVESGMPSRLSGFGSFNWRSCTAFQCEPEGRFLEFHMGEQNKLEVITRRRALSLMGLGASLSLSVPSTVLTVLEAEAQQPPPQPPPLLPPLVPGAQPGTQPGARTGTERRQARRTGRVKRRAERRKSRAKRRELRREAPKT
jgi:hypothetical protein